MPNSCNNDLTCGLQNTQCLRQAYSNCLFLLVVAPIQKFISPPDVFVHWPGLAQTYTGGTMRTAKHSPMEDDKAITIW